MKKILLASTNKKKKLRIQKLLKLIDKKYEIFLPSDLNIGKIEIVEGDDVLANAELKARAYWGKTDLPIIGYDQGLEIEGENLPSAFVKRNALNGNEESSFSEEEVYKFMTKFYMDVASRHGGEVSARWLDAFVLVNREGKTCQSIAYRPILITNEPRGKIDIKSPVTNLYKVIPINKYVCELTAEEDFVYRQKMIQSALLEILNKK